VEQNASGAPGLGRVMLKQGSVIGPFVQFGIGRSGNGEVGRGVGGAKGGPAVGITVGGDVGAVVGMPVGDIVG